MNPIKVVCSFCKREFTLTWEDRVFDCDCGVRHEYRPNQGKPMGKDYAKRQEQKWKKFSI
jgi:hypothetical protein